MKFTKIIVSLIMFAISTANITNKTYQKKEIIKTNDENIILKYEMTIAEEIEVKTQMLEENSSEEELETIEENKTPITEEIHNNTKSNKKVANKISTDKVNDNTKEKQNENNNQNKENENNNQNKENENIHNSKEEIILRPMDLNIIYENQEYNKYTGLLEKMKEFKLNYEEENEGKQQ